MIFKYEIGSMKYEKTENGKRKTENGGRNTVNGIKLKKKYGNGKQKFVEKIYEFSLQTIFLKKLCALLW